MGASRKQSMPKFSKNKHFLPPDTHAYVVFVLSLLKSPLKANQASILSPIIICLTITKIPMKFMKYDC